MLKLKRFLNLIFVLLLIIDLTKEESQVHVICSSINKAFLTPTKLCRWATYDTVSNSYTNYVGFDYLNAQQDCPGGYSLATLDQFNIISNPLINTLSCYETMKAWKRTNLFELSNNIIIIQSNGIVSFLNETVSSRPYLYFLCEANLTLSSSSQSPKLDCSTMDFVRVKFTVTTVQPTTTVKSTAMQTTAMQTTTVTTTSSTASKTQQPTTIASSSFKNTTRVLIYNDSSSGWQPWYTKTCIIQKTRRTQDNKIEQKNFTVQNIHLCDFLDESFVQKLTQKLQEKEKSEKISIKNKTDLIISNLTVNYPIAMKIASKSFTNVAIASIAFFYTFIFLIDLTKLIKIKFPVKNKQRITPYGAATISSTNEKLNVFEDVRKANNELEFKFKKFYFET